MTCSTQRSMNETIVTLTMNPALDVTADAQVVRPTDKIRCVGARYDPGGGGVNVAQVAHNLGSSVVAVLPAGGATGDMLTKLLGHRDQHRAAVPICAPRASAVRRRAGGRGGRASFGGGVGQVRRGEWKPSTGGAQRLLPTDRRHVPWAWCAAGVGHVGRRPAAR